MYDTSPKRGHHLPQEVYCAPGWQYSQQWLNKDDLSLHTVPQTRSIKARQAGQLDGIPPLEPSPFSGVLPYFSSVSLSAPLPPCLCFLLSGVRQGTRKPLAWGGFDGCRLFGTLAPQIKLIKSHERLDQPTSSTDAAAPQDTDTEHVFICPPDISVPYWGNVHTDPLSMFYWDCRFFKTGPSAYIIWKYFFDCELSFYFR